MEIVRPGEEPTDQNSVKNPQLPIVRTFIIKGWSEKDILCAKEAANEVPGFEILPAEPSADPSIVVSGVNYPEYFRIFNQLQKT